MFVILFFACNKEEEHHVHTYTLSGTASGSQEIPSNPSAGTATLTGSYDGGSKMMHYEISFSGLSGTPTAAHFHGPAFPGSNAAVLIPITITASPLVGMETLNDTLQTHLLGGKMYFNLHTAAYPGGEIRGQIIVTHNN